MIAKLHCITQGSPENQSQLCEDFCRAGAKWIQLRVKNVEEPAYLSIAEECRAITNRFGVKLIVNDNLSVALKSDADGIHLGQTDMNTLEARKLVPEGFIIGGTANTFTQIVQHYKNGVDYVGLGPYQTTQTKKNLSPVLGVEGYTQIISKLHQNNIRIPIIAIGGIQLHDVEILNKTGIYGVAVSGLIANASNKNKIINEIERLNYETA